MSAKTPAPDLGFIHRFLPATTSGRKPLILLHGTGGDENDLIPLGQRMAPGAALLSPRGQVSENGMPRFFRRISEGVFDVEDLNRRSDDLAVFIQKARAAYGIEAPVAVGFSNGANVAWSTLLRHPGALSGAVLMRAALPFDTPEPKRLPGTPVLMLSGAADPMVPAEQRERLAQTLKIAGAVLTSEMLPAGHNLTPQDLAIVQRWLTALG
ncbi:MAG: hydrolase [Xanthobacteraceae bacterium]|jgi:phospholipase/carboxylesterase|nr:hydrolase [Xanthobacteraceae bacterium]